MPTSVQIMPNRLVVALAYDRLCTFEFGIATEVFGLPRPEMGPDWYRFAVCAIEPGPLRATGGFHVIADGGLELLEDAGTIVIPGWRGAMAEPVPPALIESLRRAHARGARLMSICSGVFVLAAAGLLSGRKATTHWHYAEQLSAAYPDIQVEPNVLYVDEGSVLTSAGSAAGIDLCLHVVRHDFGPEIANRIARRLVVPPHREGGQAQFVERPVPPAREGVRFGPLFDRMRSRLTEEQPVAELAVEAGMSLRTFLRRFKAATGMPPGEWLLTARLLRARELLETTTHSIDAIAAASGFGSAAALRHHFRARLGTSPAAYRIRFARNNGGDADAARPA
ncbi:transcriptional regulator FtrA [Microvirga lenta]|uniref:transcriptional regulator FtrA n=1 Tax=Microvirga lenta TaxID=2881337 RepID=UPI001CFF62C2|nr:transcriptional regulator FtrA [Microvirga lenta]MCB5176325.1 transcriptional regulator FtrA [Microvirga lenta]